MSAHSTNHQAHNSPTPQPAAKTRKRANIIGAIARFYEFLKQMGICIGETIKLSKDIDASNMTVRIIVWATGSIMSRFRMHRTHRAEYRT